MGTKMRLKLAAVALALFGNAYAITLEDAVKTALEKNNALRAKKLEVEEKLYDVKLAKARLLPKVDLFTRYNKTTEPPYAIMNRMEVKKLSMMPFPNFNDPGKYQLFKTGFKASLPIWMGGKLRLAVDLSKDEVKAAKEQLKRSKSSVIFDVVRAYYNVLTARSFVETAELAVKDAERHLKDAEAAYRAGIGLKSDVLRAKVYLEQMEENLIKAKSNYQVALRALNVAMGLYPGRETEVDGDLTYREFGFNLDRLVQEALKKRPEVKELQVRLSQSDKMIKMAKADFLPQLGAFGEVFAADDSVPWNKENSSWMVGFGASINIFNGGAKFNRLKKRRIEKLKLQEFVEKVKKGIAFEVSRAYYNFVAAKKRVELAKSAIDSAQEGLRIVEKRYRNGLATITELLDAQTALNQARSNYVAALSGYRLSVVEVYHAAGILEEKYSELVE